MLKIISLVTTAILALTVPLIAQEGGRVLHVIEAQDLIIQIRAKTRHTTVIVLPAAENVLDFVVGDSEYWHLTGAANLAFLKPIAEGVTTNVALVCESGPSTRFSSPSKTRASRISSSAWKPRRTLTRAFHRASTNRPLSPGVRLRPIRKWRRQQ